jgi:hypothetical protein
LVFPLGFRLSQQNAFCDFPPFFENISGLEAAEGLYVFGDAQGAFGFRAKGKTVG